MKKRIIKPLASLKLAVLIIVALGTITAWGTFVEADLDAAAAQKLVYHSVWMYGVMALLAINLTAVMIDRWPWQKRHTGFVFAHIGILILLLGSIVTRYWGVDGSISIGIGENARQVVVSQTDLTVYTSFDGSSYRKLYDREVDFFLDPPSAEEPVEIDVPEGKIKVVDYMPYTLREQKIVEATGDKVGSAVRFQLQNPNVSMTEWLIQPGPTRDAVKDLGPAQVILTTTPGAAQVKGRNTVVLRPKAGSEELDYEIHTAREGTKVRRGTVKPGDTVETGWMGLVLRVLKYMPKAKEEVVFNKIDRPSELSVPALRVDYKGETHWMAANSLLKIFSENAVYIVSFANRRLDIGFDLKLKDFEVGRYQGTMRAASYQSLVDVPGLGERLISMNEPLKHAGYTFYQASFSEDPDTGKPIVSVLSVNHDPGRWIKYLGSLLIVLGTIHLFYFKRKAARAAAAAAKATSSAAAS